LAPLKRLAGKVVSEMTHNTSSGTLNPTIRVLYVSEHTRTTGHYTPQAAQLSTVVRACCEPSRGQWRRCCDLGLNEIASLARHYVLLLLNTSQRVKPSYLYEKLNVTACVVA